MVILYFLNILCSSQSNFLESQLNQCEIVIIYRDTCPHSQAALKTLSQHHFRFRSIEEDSNPQLVNYVKKNYHKTFPAIFVNGMLFGGNDKLQQALKEGTFPIQPALKLSDYIATLER